MQKVDDANIMHWLKGFVYLYKIQNEMTTIVIDDKTIDAKKMIEYLRTQRYAKIIDEKTPNASLQRSIDEAETGMVICVSNVNELLDGLKK